MSALSYKKLLELILDPKKGDLGNVGVALVKAARKDDNKP